MGVKPIDKDKGGMRGYIQGALWALFVGTIAVSIVSYLDDQRTANESVVADELRGLMDTLEETPAADPATAAAETETALSPIAPVAQTDIVANLSPAAAGAPPPFISIDVPPFIDPWVPVLANTARQPELPLLDGDSAPDAIPEPLEAVVAAPAPEALPDVDTVEAPTPEPVPAPEIVPPAEDGNQTATVETPEPAPAEAVSAVVINRPGAEPTETAGQPAVVVEAPEIAEDAPALQRFAAAFENPEDLPVLAVILIADGAGDDQLAAVSELGFAPTVVVNALAPDAGARLQAYRNAGAEVAMELALPQGALPADVEVAFEAALGLMPEAAMLFSSGSDAVLGNRQVTSQVLQVLGANGMGFVALERGLGGAVRAAEQSGVAAAAIARDLDGNGETSGAIARALDQAAFRARQSGDAVLLARLNGETLTALRDWAATNEGAGTVMGPVSAVLSATGE